MSIAQLQSLYTQYEAYESAGGSGTFSPTGVGLLVINGTDVGIEVKDNNTADFSSLTSELQSEGMQILDSSPTYGLIEGMLPIGQLPNAAELSPTLSITPMTNPIPAAMALTSSPQARDESREPPRNRAR